MAISTEITLRDSMSAKLEAITKRVERVNAVLSKTDTISDQVGMGAAYDAAADSISRADAQMNNFNQHQNEAANKAEKVQSKFERLVNTVKNLAIVRFASQFGKQILDLADTMTATRVRLDLMNDGLQTTEELQSMIMASANRSRASYQTTADAVSKMGIMAKDAFGSNDELIKFTELINKQFTIAGTSAAGVDAAMLQLTQAMASGVLRGEELNSVFEQAPTIIQTIADYLDVPIGQIRAMAQEGQITSTVVKNAMLASADEINAKFESMPMTFSQVWTIAKNVALNAFEPVIQTIGAVANWIYENWSKISPVFYGLAAAAAYAVALGIQTTATWIANGAAKEFFMTLLTNPLFWIALAVGVVVAALYKMIQAVGGVKNAWEICKAALLVAWAALKVSFFATYNWIENLIDKLKLCWQKAGVAIADYMGDMKVNVLTVLQNMINGAISIINDFIGLLNKIPGVNIDLIEQVTFATTAAAENEAAKQSRANSLNQYEADIREAQVEREATYSAARQELADATSKLSKTYANARSQAAQSNSDAAVSWNADGSVDVGNVDSVGSVGKIDSDVNIADEDLKFLRDVAEMRYVQNFVTLTPTVAMDAQISERVDLDDVVSAIERKLEGEFIAAAEGVYN